MEMDDFQNLSGKKLNAVPIFELKIWINFTFRQTNFKIFLKLLFLKFAGKNNEQYF